MKSESQVWLLGAKDKRILHRDCPPELSKSHTPIGDLIPALSRRWRCAPGLPSAADRVPARPSSFPEVAAADQQPRLAAGDAATRPDRGVADPPEAATRGILLSCDRDVQFAASGHAERGSAQRHSRFWAQKTAGSAGFGHVWMFQHEQLNPSPARQVRSSRAWALYGLPERASGSWPEPSAGHEATWKRKAVREDVSERSKMWKLI